MRLRCTRIDYVRLAVKQGSDLRDAKRDAIAVAIRNESDVRFELGGQDYVIRWADVEAKLRGGRHGGATTKAKDPAG